MTRPLLYRVVRILAAMCEPEGRPLPKPSANCTRLARELEVSKRTVLRDIDFLRDSLRLPIEYHRGRHSFYLTRPVEVNMRRLLALAGGERRKGGA